VVLKSFPIWFFRLQWQSFKYGCAGESDDVLHPVEIISSAQTDPSHKGNVRIHYVGYSSAYDEWRPCDNIVHFVSLNEEFCLHKELYGSNYLW